MNKISMLLVLLATAGILSACQAGAPVGTAITDGSVRSAASGGETTDSTVSSGKTDETPQVDYMRRGIDDNIKDGNDALQKKDYDRAEKVFLVALSQCDLYTGQEARQAAILNNLAAIYEEKEMYLQAVPLLTKAQKLFIRAFGRKNQAVYITLGNLGRVLAKQHRWEEAANVYQTAVGLMEEDAKVVKSESYQDMLVKCGEAWEKAGNAFKANKINAKIKAFKAPAK